MRTSDIILASILSASLVNCEQKKDGLNSTSLIQPVMSEQVGDSIQSDLFSNFSNLEKENSNICLTLDGDNLFTHKKVLETIKYPESTVLELPLSQLYQKYGNRSHPLRVSGVGKDFKALLGKGGVEQLISDIPQKLSTHTEKITSDTRYLVDDTLRFKLINPVLEKEFSQYLNEQLQENGFEEFSDDLMLKGDLSDEFVENKKSDSFYDIVVKKLSDGKYGLALYRDGELFMATYASVGLNNRKTKVGQFKILRKNPYYFSRKYKSPMPEGLEFDEGGFWMHQGNVTGYPASHGCVRLPGIYASILFSMVDNADVFISKNLYK